MDRDPDKARDEALELRRGFEPDRREKIAHVRKEIVDAEERADALLMLPERWIY